MPLDGAELCNGISHLAAGLKVMDVCAIDPHMGVPLGSIKAGSAINFFEFSNIQSHDFCAILQMIIAQDSKKVYKEDFHDFF